MLAWAWSMCAAASTHLLSLTRAAGTHTSSGSPTSSSGCVDMPRSCLSSGRTKLPKYWAIMTWSMAFSSTGLPYRSSADSFSWRWYQPSRPPIFSTTSPSISPLSRSHTCPGRRAVVLYWLTPSALITPGCSESRSSISVFDIPSTEKVLNPRAALVINFPYCSSTVSRSWLIRGRTPPVNLRGSAWVSLVHDLSTRTAIAAYRAVGSTTAWAWATPHWASVRPLPWRSSWCVHILSTADMSVPSPRSPTVTRGTSASFSLVSQP